jgi:hypothetical protein
MSNQLKFISAVVYRLKRRFGVPIQLLKRTSTSVDIETGRKTIVKAFVNVRRAIVLPTREHREFFYDLAFIAAAKNFTYGAHIDSSERRFILDRKDLRGWAVEVGQWIVYQNQRYDVKEVSDFEEDRSYYVLAKQSVAAATGEVVEVGDTLAIGDDADD